MKQGIVGHASDKFIPETEQLAKKKISEILDSFSSGDVMVSGHCPLGGIDIWAEELAVKRNIPVDIKSPKQHVWDGEYGFKQRNLDIAKESEILWVILVKSYPKDYVGRKFTKCYHCNVDTHVKSGACWTAKKAKAFGNIVKYVVI